MKKKEKLKSFENGNISIQGELGTANAGPNIDKGTVIGVSERPQKTYYCNPQTGKVTWCDLYFPRWDRLISREVETSQ